MITIRDIDKDHVTGYLGNKLFQIAAAYRLAIENGDELVLPRFEFANLFRNQFFKIVDAQDLRIEHEYNEPCFHFQKIPYQKNTNLNGYFQSPKYFAGGEKERFSPNFQLEYDIFKTLVPSLGIDFETVFAYHRTCAIHVRRGDFAHFQFHHPILPEQYYTDAIEQISSEVDYFVVCSNDIEWCKQFFIGPKFIFSETVQERSQGNRNAAFDLYLMSYCDHNIIANSSFSWWSAYLNGRSNKKIFCPGKKYDWFGSALQHHNMEDFFPESWIKL